uniref:PLA2c domain-containing protein n=1 Tax=Lepisosteus oculatus TaxID=7918 RepID=W5NJ61_LEPOC
RSAFLHSTSVRLSSSLSKGEEEAVAKRREIVNADLKTLLGKELPMQQTPVIAILGSGGGLRAMIALLGSLCGLKETGLLDSAMYLCGVSGSTWAMSSVCENPSWVKELDLLVTKILASLGSSGFGFSKDRLLEASKTDVFSCTNIWGTLIVSQMIKKLYTCTLPEHNDPLISGKLPYPIYAAIDKDLLNTEKTEMWFEFTPYEAGFPAYGAFISTKNFGSQFEKGELKHPHPQHDLCYLQGLWGSALAVKEILEKYYWQVILPSKLGRPRVMYKRLCRFSESLINHVNKGICFGSNLRPLLKLNVFSVMQNTWAIITTRIHLGESGTGSCCSPLGNMQFCLKNAIVMFFCEWGGGNPNTCLHGLGTLEYKIYWKEYMSITEMQFVCFLEILGLVCKMLNVLESWQWGTNYNFLYGCDSLLSGEQPPSVSSLVNNKFFYLVDAGLAINSAYPLVLRPQRQVDVIISCDYSAGDDPFLTVKQAAGYAKANSIPFPEIHVPAGEVGDCYVYSGAGAPTVIHMPLFNSTNDKICGLSDYPTLKFSYTEKEVNRLFEVSKDNIVRNKNKLLEAIGNKLCGS